MSSSRWGLHPAPSVITQTDSTRILDLPVASSLGAHVMPWASNPCCVLATNDAEAAPGSVEMGDQQGCPQHGSRLPSPRGRVRPPMLFADGDLLPFNAQKPEMLCSGRWRRGDLACQIWILAP